LKKLKLNNEQLALAVRVDPQSLAAIISGKSDINSELAVKLEKELNLEEGYFMYLQNSYEVKRIANRKEIHSPDLDKFRPVLFWDTDINKIQWNRQYRSVIRPSLSMMHELSDTTRARRSKVVRRMVG